MDVFFCGGVYGVGKSTLCRSLADEANAVHISAGALLRAAGLAEPSHRAVFDVRRNQTYLYTTLQAYRQQHRIRRILLDGHFCLLTPEHRIRPLPLSLFKSIEPKVLLIVLDRPSIIAKRLAQRDKTFIDTALVQGFQERELSRAEFVGRQLAVPLRKITPHESVVELARWITNTA